MTWEDHVKLSCCDHSFPLLDHVRACELVRMLGFEAIDIAVWGAHSHLVAADVAADPSRWAAEVERHVHAAGLTVADVFLIPDADYAVMAANHPLPSERLRGRERFRRVLEFATGLGAPGVTVIPGVEFDGVSHEASLERAAEELAARVGLGRDADLRVSVEPHAGSVSATPEDVARLLALAPGLELTLDYSHFTLQGIAAEQLDPVLGDVRHVHARAARRDRVQAGMRENEIDFPRALLELHRAGFEGHVATEYLWIDLGHANECDVLSETILMRDLLQSG